MYSSRFTVVYAGYFFGQHPCGWLIGRYPAQKVLAICILIWGILVILLTQARSFPSACESYYTSIQTDILAQWLI